MKCQKNKFNMTGKKVYLNCAYMSPMLKKVEKAGIRGIHFQRKPDKIMPEHFFNNIEEIKKSFAKLINCKNPDRIAYVPAASYGLANVTNNIKLEKGEHVVVVGDQFPSNVYPWMNLTKKYKGNLNFVLKDTSSKNPGRKWNEDILKAINKKTKVVSMGIVHWADGTIFDMKKIRKKTSENNALLIIDGTQSIGSMPFNLNEIQPDALVCAGYKWLMGPYGSGLAYYGKYFDDGKPIEESWINRKGSDDFSNLINYQDEYAKFAKRYSVGQQSNFINVEMLNEGIKQINKWGVDNVYNYIKAISTKYFDMLDKSKVWFEEDEYRGGHLFGLRPKNNLKKILKKIREKNIYISLRGDIIRVSPSVYNTEKDVLKLFECVSENA